MVFSKIPDINTVDFSPLAGNAFNIKDFTEKTIFYRKDR